jgi:hypothetical protein
MTKLVDCSFFNFSSIKISLIFQVSSLIIKYQENIIFLILDTSRELNEKLKLKAYSKALA